MARTVAIRIQDFEKIIRNNCFYVDKTKFIKECWENADDVTLITRPRRFGKTLTINMLDHFFSIKYAGQEELFEGLETWKEEKYQNLQGTHPVISLTFANIKEQNFETTKLKINMLLEQLYQQNSFLKNDELLSEHEKAYFDRVSGTMNDADATFALHRLSEFLSRYYVKNVDTMNDYMNEISCEIFSSFDTGKKHPGNQNRNVSTTGSAGMT